MVAPSLALATRAGLDGRSVRFGVDRSAAAAGWLAGRFLNHQQQASTAQRPAVCNNKPNGMRIELSHRRRRGPCWCGGSKQATNQVNQVGANQQ